MKSCLFAILTFALALAPSLPRAESPNPHGQLCKADEEAYAGCRLRGSGKLLAFCIAKGTQLPSTPMGDRAPRLVVPKARTLVYRFGRPGRIELEYPKRRAGSADKFRYAQAAYSRGGETRFRFHNGGFRYDYVSRLIARGQGHDNYHSLSIYRGKKRVALLKCEDANK